MKDFQHESRCATITSKTNPSLSMRHFWLSKNSKKFIAKTVNNNEASFKTCTTKLQNFEATQSGPDLGPDIFSAETLITVVTHKNFVGASNLL